IGSSYGVRFHWRAWPVAPHNERSEDNHCECADSNEAARSEERLPPTGMFFRKARRDSRPDALAIGFAWVRNGHGVHCGEDRFDFFERGTALGAGFKMRGEFFAAGAVAIVKCDELFFHWVFHFYSIPIARAVCRPSANGSSATRSFWTARKTVFFAAVVLDFKTAAIFSMPPPSPWRMTIAVRSAGGSCCRACCMRRAS